MKHKQTLAMLLAAAMVLSMPLGAYAQGTAEGENSTDSVQPYVVDTEAPTISKISLDKTEINAGESLKVSIEGKDNLSGIKNFIAYFENAEGRIINSNFSSFSGNVMEAEMEISEYEASGEYHLDFIEIYDNANNSRSYSNKEGNHYEALPNNLSFTVINDDPVTPPTQPEGNKPSRPGSSANSSANSSNASGVVNYESEKPDPADKQAVKAYNFWQDAKSKIRKTAEGKTLRLSMPKEITNLPASVMETLRKENVSLRLNWNGKTITIPAGKAQPKQKLRIYWTMQTLEKLYNA